MSQELRTFTVNLKSLDQDIRDPIVAGGADARGRTFKIIFDQEAAAQVTPETKVYLSWRHKQLDVKGYNVFTQTSDDPITWEITWPQSMLHEGDVLCCVELVDTVSIAASTNFTVHVLSDPNDGSTFVVSDDFTLFQNAVIRLNCIGDQMRQQMTQQKVEFEDMLVKFNVMKEDVDEAVEKSEEATKVANDANEKVTESLAKVDNLTDIANETLKKANDALAGVDDKLDKELVGIDFNKYDTIKDYIDKNIQEPHLEIIEFIGEDE